MIVVADSGPLHYLILLDHVELLRRFMTRSWCRRLSPVNWPPPALPSSYGPGLTDRPHGLTLRSVAKSPQRQTLLGKMVAGTAFSCLSIFARRRQGAGNTQFSWRDYSWTGWRASCYS